MTEPKPPKRPTGPDPGEGEMGKWMDDTTDFAMTKANRRLLEKLGLDPDEVWDSIAKPKRKT